MRLWRWVVLIVITSASFTISPCDADEQLVRQLKAEWRRYLDATVPRQLHAVIETQSQGKHDSIAYETHMGPSAHYLKYADSQRAFGFNRHYVFDLSRPDPNSQWAIRSLQPITGDSREIVDRMREDIQARQMPVIPGLGLQSLESIVDAPTFNCEVVSPNDPEGWFVIEFDATSEPGLHQFGNRRLEQRGVAKLDPKSFMLPVEYQVHFKLVPLSDGLATEGESSGTINYERLRDYPTARSLRIRDCYELVDGTLEIIRSIRIVTSSTEYVPENEFYLTSFGLPEPRFNASVSPSWTWWLALTILVALLTIVTRRVSKRWALEVNNR